MCACVCVCVCVCVKDRGGGKDSDKESLLAMSPLRPTLAAFDYQHFKDRRDQVKPNPLAKLSLSDQQQQCRAERKVVSCCLSIIDAASCSAILLLVDTVCSQAIQAGL